jgi:hypothetical protein
MTNIKNIELLLILHSIQNSKLLLRKKISFIAYSVRMKRFYCRNRLIILGIIGLTTCLPVQLSAQNESIYYKLTHPETKAVSFLLGTYHNYPEGWYEVPKEVKEALAKTTSLITETGLARSTKYSTKINQATRYKQGQTVLDKLKGSRKDNFQKYIDEKIAGSESEKMRVLNRKPYFMLGSLFALRFSDSVMSMEAELKALAIDNDIQIKGLEPDEKRLLRYAKKYSRMSNTNNLGLVTEFQMLSKAMMFSKYLDGDILAMSKMAGGATPMAIERNQYWVPQLVEMLREPSFVAVGAGHLIGELAVQELLKEQGFSVTPIALSHPRPQVLIDLLLELDPPKQETKEKDK